MEVNLKTIVWFLWIITWVGIRNSCCQKPNLDAILNRRQDVYIAGFFPFGKGVEQSGTGRGVMPSVKLALDHVNEHETVLRNYRLHMWWNDTECNAAVGVKSFFDMMHSGPHKLMLFGAACTHVTDPIAKASKHWHLTQLSYADTHPMFTKDAFPNFFRIVPSENAFNLPRLELLKHFNWTRVGTIYQNEPRYALAHNRLVADLDSENFIVEETQSFATEVRTALTKLKEKDIRIILGNFNETWAIRVFCEAYRLEMYGRTYQWLIQGTYSENWWRRRAPCARQHLTAALDTVILTDLLPLSTTGEVTVSGITAKEYQVEYDRRRGSEYSRFHGYTYDGIWAVALAIQNVAQRAKQKHKERGVADFKYRDKDWEEMFLEALSNVSFEGVTGPVRFHNNERRASILLKQFQGEELGEVKVGEYCSELSRLDLATGLPFKWGGKYPPKDRTLHQIEHTQVNITIYAVLASCSVLGIMLATCFLAMNIHYRNQRYIKMSSPHLNNLIIVGCILTYLSVIFLGLDSGLSSIAAFPYICTARAWLLMAGFSLAFGAMFSKTWRVHSIFTDVKLNKKVIKDYQLFMVVGVLLAIDLAIMTTWQISDPFYRATKQMEPYPHPSSEDILIVQENEYCQSERMTIFIGIIYAYKGLLLVFGAFLAWETRHVSIPALNDSKHIGLSVYNVLIMCIMGAAIALVLTDHKDALFVLIAIFIIFCTTGTLCLVFVPKLLELRRNGQPGTTDKSRIRATLRPTGKARDCRSPGAELEARLRDLRTHNHKFRRTLQARDNEIQMLLSKLGSDATSITSSVKTDSKSPTVPGRNVRLNVPPNVTKDAPSQMDTSDITSLCSLSASQGAEVEYYNVGVDRPKPQPSAPPHETSKSESADTVPLKSSTGGKRESATKNVSFKNHLDYSAGSNTNHTSAVRNVPEKDQLAKFPYGWTQEEPQTQPAPPPTTQLNCRQQELSEPIQPPATTVAPTPVVPAPVRSHRRTASMSRPTAELVMQVPPPDLPLASERKIIGAERDEQASCPLRRQMTFDAGQDIDMDKDYSTAERKKISQRRDSEKRRNNFIVAQSDLWDTNTFTYNCPKPQAATHHHSPMQRSVSEKSQRHSSQSGTPTHHSSTSRESETKHHSGDRRSSNASMHSTHGASSVGGESRSSRDSLLATRGGTPEGYREAETLRMHDRASKRRGSEFPQPVSTPTHQSQQKRRQSCAQVRSIADERPTPPPQPPASLAVVPATPRSPARPVLDRTDTPRHLQPHHHQSTPNVGAARQKKSSPSKTRSRRSTPTAPPPAPLSAVQPQARKMYSASSESELFECAILPIFHKLLTERHKSQPHGLNLVYGVSCPNISIKCDIVEYL